MKKIYKIQFESWSYDQYDAFVVRAIDADSAIKIIKDKYPAETEKRMWKNVSWKDGYTVTEILLDGDDEILLSSFNAG